MIELNETLYALDDLGKLYDECEAEHKKIVSDYRGTLMEGYLAEFQSTFKKKLDMALFTLTSKVRSLKKEIEKASEYRPDNTTGLAEASALLKNEGIDWSTLEKIAEAFRGNQTALNLLHASALPEYKGFFLSYMFNIDEGFRTIDSSIRRLSASENYNAIPTAISEIKAQLQKLAFAYGIDEIVKARFEKMQVENVTRLAEVDADSLRG